MRSNSFYRIRGALRLIPQYLALAGLLCAQNSPAVTAVPPPRAVGVRNAAFSAKISFQVRNGYHVNSNAPNEDYLIPLRLTWNPLPLQLVETVYPKPVLESYSFSSKPVSVYLGDFEIVARFMVPATAALGPLMLNGKLRYQACNNSACFPPRTVEVKLPVEIRAK